MKIIYIVKTKLHYYPPCVSQIRMLKKIGIDVEVLYGTSNTSALDLLKKEQIKYKKIGNMTDENNTKLKKAISWLKFRIYLKKELKKYSSDENIIIWFGTGETVLPMIGLLRKYNYITTFLELYDETPIKIKLLKKIANNAVAVTVCEKDRAYIMQYWWKLKKLPYVFPNKPYNLTRKKGITPTIELTEKIINKIKNDNIILYQGIIQNTEELVEFAKALNLTKKHYKFLIMGIDKYNSIKEIKKYYSDIEYIEYIPAPFHLEITSYARIGITFYRPDSLNKVYCAPNKIYEYTGFGIPVICNDIPGLVNTIGNSNSGKCIEIKCNEIVKTIDFIEENYNDLSKNAVKFFDSTDNLSEIEKLINEIECKMGKKCH